ncbi:hypothetical protein G7Y89_g12670 [Cudoniella acicularis]|uniref:Adenosine deaminase domain-containing protein n=1 Tax=Cudoniella acicularis TaxID=354080 RepID=A0A8H4VX52_9HELO|nr:hypothetical protein G7Y89_g12670 [Cudoniella acicularis]
MRPGIRTQEFCGELGPGRPTGGAGSLVLQQFGGGKRADQRQRRRKISGSPDSWGRKVLGVPDGPHSIVAVATGQMLDRYWASGTVLSLCDIEGCPLYHHQPWSLNSPEMDFRSLPKIELHAHLSGSISRESLHDVWVDKIKKGQTTLRDPLEEMPAGKFDYDLETFFPLFSKYIYNLCNDSASLAFTTQSVLQDFQRDGVIYLELRTTPRAIPSANITKDDYLKTILDCIQSFNASSSMKTNLILSIDRRNDEATALQVVDLAIAYRPQGVVGVDLCGDPAVGDVSIFQPAFEKAAQHGLKITIHFAEAPQSSTPKELWTLLSFKPDRIGHVINVPEDVKEEIKKRKLGLELCLSCNVHAKMITGTFGDHHFGWWKETGCPIALSTDDVGVFGSSLSNEYALIVEHFGLDRAEICELARDAIDIIFGSEEDKEREGSFQIWINDKCSCQVADAIPQDKPTELQHQPINQPLGGRFYLFLPETQFLSQACRNTLSINHNHGHDHNHNHKQSSSSNNGDEEEDWQYDMDEPEEMSLDNLLHYIGYTGFPSQEAAHILTRYIESGDTPKAGKVSLYMHLLKNASDTTSNEEFEDRVMQTIRLCDEITNETGNCLLPHEHDAEDHFKHARWDVEQMCKVKFGENYQIPWNTAGNGGEGQQNQLVGVDFDGGRLQYQPRGANEWQLVETFMELLTQKPEFLKEAFVPVIAARNAEAVRRAAVARDAIRSNQMAAQFGGMSFGRNDVEEEDADEAMYDG